MNRENSTDRRILRTRRSIERALLALLSKHPLEKITVEDICDEALVNRGTFYRHYHDKQEVADSLAKRGLAEFEDEAMGAIRNLAAGKPAEDDDRADEALGILIPLKSYIYEGTSVEDHVRQIMEDALSILSQAGMLEQDPATEAWAYTELAFEYSRYCRSVCHPVSVDAYVAAILEAAHIYQKILEPSAR